MNKEEIRQSLKDGTFSPVGLTDEEIKFVDQENYLMEKDQNTGRECKTEYALFGFIIGGVIGMVTGFGLTGLTIVAISTGVGALIGCIKDKWLIKK